MTHLLDLDLLARGVPHDRYDELRAREPVYWQERDSGRGYWALLRQADIVQVSRDRTFSAEAKGMFIDDIDGLLPTLLNLDPPRHQEVRRPLLDRFSRAAARDLEPRMREILRPVFDRAADLGDCDFVRDLASPLPIQIICEMLGIPEADRAHLGHMADVLAAADDPELAAELGEKSSNEAAMELGIYALRMGQERAGSGAPVGADLVSLLSRATLGGKPVEIGAFSGLFVQILIGGNETTRTLLGQGIRELMDDRDSYRALEADASLLPDAVEEMLRWVTPVHYFRRTALADVELGGRSIRAGDRVVLFYTAANRDPEAFTAPHRFDIRRRPNPHVAFGVGEHFCLGARIARLEARVFFEEFFRRFASIEPTGPPRRIRSNQLNSLKALPVRVRPR